MATTQHYLWAAGHFILLLATLRYALAYITFKSVAYSFYYKAGFTGAIASYAIVCQKSLGTPQANAVYLRKALLDENVQYLLLALFWLRNKPIALALLPYATFSLFHALTFTRTTILPRFLPSTPAPAGSGQPPQQPQLARMIQLWVKGNYDRAMKVVAYTEFVLLLRVVLGALTFQNSFLTPIVFSYFLRQRYYHSQFTRDAVTHISAVIDGYATKQGTPPIVLTIWTQVKQLVVRYGGSSVIEQQQQPAAGGAAGTPPRAR